MAAAASNFVSRLLGEHLKSLFQMPQDIGAGVKLLKNTGDSSCVQIDLCFQLKFYMIEVCVYDQYAGIANIAIASPNTKSQKEPRTGVTMYRCPCLTVHQIVDQSVVEKGSTLNSTTEWFARIVFTYVPSFIFSVRFLHVSRE